MCNHSISHFRAGESLSGHSTTIQTIYNWAMSSSAASIERHSKEEEKHAADARSDTSSEDDTVLGYTEAPVVSMSSATIPPMQQHSEAVDVQTPAGQSGSGRNRSRALSVVGTSQLHQLNRHSNSSHGGGYASVAHNDNDEDWDDDDEDGSPAEELELGVLAKGSEGRGGWLVSACLLLLLGEECCKAEFMAAGRCWATIQRAHQAHRSSRWTGQRSSG